MSRTSLQSGSAERLKHLFPPPHFLAMPAVGLDVSDSSVKFLEFRPGTRGARLGGWGSRPLPAGVRSGGKIADPKRLAEELIAFRREHGLSFVHASLPEQQAYFFKTEVPIDIKASRIRQILEFKLESNVPIPLQSAVFDYDLIHPRGKEEHIDVGVTVYPREAIEQFTDVLIRAGLTPLSFEIEAQAIERAVVPTRDEATRMIIDFGETRTGVAIIYRSMLVFTSTLDVCGRTLTRGIMEALHLSPQETDRFKNEEGILKRSENTQVVSLLMETVADLKAEIERHIGYWDSRRREDTEHTGPIESIILCGGNSNLAGLPEYLSESLRVPVERANIWRNIFSFKDAVPEIDFAHSLSYATAAGLALRALE